LVPLVAVKVKNNVATDIGVVTLFTVLVTPTFDNAVGVGLFYHVVSLTLDQGLQLQILLYFHKIACSTIVALIVKI
jgi:hypothetical protein